MAGPPPGRYPAKFLFTRPNGEEILYLGGKSRTGTWNVRIHVCRCPLRKNVIKEIKKFKIAIKDEIKK